MAFSFDRVSEAPKAVDNKPSTADLIMHNFDENIARTLNSHTWDLQGKTNPIQTDATSGKQVMDFGSQAQTMALYGSFVNNKFSGNAMTAADSAVFGDQQART